MMTNQRSTYADPAAEPTTPRYLKAMPSGVRVYATSADYVAEDPSRAARNGIDGDLGGWDVCDGFRLTEHASHGGGESEWRISVVGRDVYAVLRRMPHASRYTFRGPVWLIDQVPTMLGASVYDDPLKNLLWQVERRRFDEDQPDSLLDAVRTIRTAFAVVRDLERDPFALAETARKLLERDSAASRH